MKNKTPYVTLIDTLCQKLGKAMRRGIGELERMNANAAAEQLAEEATQQFNAYIQETLEKTGHPVLGAEATLADLPKTGQAWVFNSVEGTKNFASGLAPVCSVFSLLKEGRPLFTAAYFPVEDILMVAEAGEGASAITRFRTGQNKETAFKGKLVFVLPEQLTAARLQKLNDAGAVTRARGNAVADVADVVASRGQAALGEAKSLATKAFILLMAKESQAKVSSLEGTPFTWDDEVFILSPLACHEESLKLLA